MSARSDRLRASLVTMNTYHVENQWGGSGAPWHDAGLFLLGGRNGQNAVAFDITSADKGQSFTGTMTYAGEGPIGFKGGHADGEAFVATNTWGGTGPHAGGEWVLGCRANQAVVKLDVHSPDGAHLLGTMTYAGEGSIGFRGTRTMANTYAVENQWAATMRPGIRVASSSSAAAAPRGSWRCRPKARMAPSCMAS